MHVLLRGSRLQQARLAAGLVLAVFVVTHLANHALGLVSLEAMEAFQTVRFALTRSWPGTVLIAAAALTHVVLGLLRLAGRRSWRMPAWEATQIASGLLIPLLLIDHVATTRGASALTGAQDFYHPALAYYWPAHAWVQGLLVVIVWGHACIGLHHWLRLAPWYGRVAPLFFAAAVLLPALALAGFMVAGREVTRALPTPTAVDQTLAAFHWPLGAARAPVETLSHWGLAVFLLALTAVAGWLATRQWQARAVRRVDITYTAGPTVAGPLGATLLEISRLHAVPHASVCGGRARCSTCRVRIEAGGSTLEPPRFAEAVTLGSVAAPAGVRLACQIRPSAALTVTRLVAPGTSGQPRIGGRDDDMGVERTLAVMFLDVRGFTRLSEKRLPYDVVFLLNRFFTAIGEAIVAEGGWIDKYMGDGLLAVFGRDTDERAACQAALAAAAGIDRALDRLNRDLEPELGERLAVGIGLHVGPLVIGRVGHPATAATTVIGRTVNVAARLEALSKEKACQLVVSRDLAQTAGWHATGVPAEPVTVRGLSAPIEVLLVTAARTVVAG